MYLKGMRYVPYYIPLLHTLLHAVVSGALLAGFVVLLVEKAFLVVNLNPKP
jgi:hypothetical protein